MTTIIRDEKGRFMKGSKPVAGFKEGHTPWSKGTKGIVKSWNKGLTKENNAVLKLAGENMSRTRKKLFKEGKLKSWNKGLTKELDERIKKNVEKMKNTKNSSEWIETIGKNAAKKSSKSLKEGHESGRIKSWIKGLTIETDERVRVKGEKHSKAIKELYSQGVVMGFKKGDLNPMKRLDLRENISKCNTGRKCSQELRKIRRENRAKQVFPVNDTSIELKIQNFLKQLQIPFFTHQYMKEIEHGYQCDVLIPSMNMVIECDGDYWHKYPIGNELDHIRTSELLEKGFRVLRLWECEINAMNINEFQKVLS